MATITELAINRPIERVEQTEEVFGFTHLGRQFQAHIVAEKAPGLRTAIYIEDEKGIRHGEIIGRIMRIGDIKTFLVHTSVNLNYFKEHTGAHVPKLIRKAVVELVAGGVFDKWNSSFDLSAGGRKTYESLLLNDDPRISVRKSTIDGVGIYEWYSISRVKTGIPKAP